MSALYDIEQIDSVMLHSKASIRYFCSFDRVQQHLLNITMEIDNPTGPTLRLIMPSWTPGSYKIRDFVSHQGDLEVVNEIGDSLPYSWSAKDQLDISVFAGTRVVRVRYTYYANERTVRTMHINRWRAFINPVNCMMYVDGRTAEFHHVYIDLGTTGWQTISTALSPVENPHHLVFAAKNYDVLADSPIEVGNHQTRHFVAAGAQHEVALIAPIELDIDWLTEKCKTIVETESQLFGGVPYDRYVFMVQVGSNVYGGLEHSRCSVNLIDISTMTDPSKAGRLLALLCHEYFHTWNVKRIRPIELGPFDYRKENYTSMLWLAEGFTSYYDDLMSYRCGFMDRDDYIRTLCDEHLAKLEAVPGRHAMSTHDASLLAWVKLYAQSPDGNNRYPSYYLAGGIITLLLELEIIASTNAKYRLDDVMRDLMKRYRANPSKGLVELEVADSIDKVCGLTGLGLKLLSTVRSTADLDYNKYFKAVGLEWSYTWDPANTKQSYTGLTLKEESGRLLVASVLEDTPAQKAGLAIDDEIIAVNGTRVQTSAGFTELLHRLADPDVELSCSCDGHLYSTKMTPTMAKTARLTQVKNPTADQQRLFDFWLQR